MVAQTVAGDDNRANDFSMMSGWSPLTMAYHELEQRFARAHRVGHAETFLSWDQSVMMPPAGAEPRAQALAELRAIGHRMLTAADMPDLFEQAAAESLDDEQRINLQEMRRSWRQQACLPADLVEARSLATSRCEHRWRQQRIDNDWQGFEPNFRQVVALAREEAAARQAAEPGRFDSGYDALLDLYVSGESGAVIDALFAELNSALPDILQQVIDQQAGQSRVLPAEQYAVTQQERVGRDLMTALGFDFERGRLDVSTHPFSTGDLGDHRVTTRYSEGDPLEGLLAIAHETGHASYEAGLPERWHGQPAGRARSMSIHESQSLLFEKQIAISRPFCVFLARLLAKRVPVLAGLNGNRLWRACTRVRPGLIRVSADEVSYPLHIMLRYDIEKALINGDMEVGDVPAAWDQRMQSALGLSTRDDFRDGCMQDIHWPMGAFGYFPSYTLGALNAAQLFAAIRRQHDDLTAQLETGDIGAVAVWLRQRVWRLGSLRSTADIMRDATGSETRADVFLDHIRGRYLDEAY